MTDFSFNKKEKLKSKLAIGLLFEKGKHQSRMPLRIIWRISDENRALPVKASVSVSKKNFNKAVNRNRIKRKLREAYRLNKSSLSDTCRSKKICMDMMIIYNGKEEKDFASIEHILKDLLQKLKTKIDQI